SDRLASGGQTRRRSIAVVAVAQRALHRCDKMRRRMEPESNRIADVQIADAGTGRFDPLRLSHDVTDCVRKAGNAVRGWDGSKRGFRDSHGAILPRERRCKYYVRKN